MQETFSERDPNKTLKMSYAEFQDCMNLSNMPITPREFDELAKEVDKQ